MKKIFSLFLMVCMIMQLSVVAFADEDVSDSSYGEILKELGIIQGSENGLDEEKEITRQEMIVIINKLSDISNEFSSFNVPDEPTFKDVPIEHWAYKHVEFAYAKGLTSGVGNNKFGVDEKINYNQASLFLIRSLGYNTSEINYDTASKEISEMYGLKLNKETVNSVLYRGEVFELLAKTLMMNSFESDSLKVDELDYDSTNFKLNFANAYTYYNIDNVSSDYIYPYKVNLNDINESYPSDLLIEYSKEMTETQKIVDKYYNNKYRVVNAVNVPKLNFNYSSTEFYSYNDAIYPVSSEILGKFNFEKNRIELDIESSEGKATSSGELLNIRKYESIDNLTPYLVIFNEDIYADVENGFEKISAIGIIVNEDDEVVHIIGETLFGQGYMK